MRLISYLLTLLLAVSLTACGGGGGSAGTTSGSPVPAVAALTTTAPATLTLAVGSSQEYSISGGTAPYKVSSSNLQISAAGIRNAVLTIGGVTPGSAVLNVSDSEGKTSLITITVTTQQLFITAPSIVSLVLNKKVSYLVGGGVPPYLITSSNSSAVDINSVNTTVTLTGLTTTYKDITTSSGATSRTFNPATIGIRDSVGATLSFLVNVDIDPLLKLSVSPSSATGNVGDSLTFLLSGGRAPYRLTISNPGIATLLPQIVALSGENFTAVLTNVGAAVVTITDGLGEKINMSLAAVNNSSSLQLSPSALKLAESRSASARLTIYGGTAPYTAFSSDTTLVLVDTPTNNAVTLNTVASKDVNQDTPVTITVIDSLGASGTSIVTIVNNN